MQSPQNDDLMSKVVTASEALNKVVLFQSEVFSTNSSSHTRNYILAEANECFARYGYWPVSFAWPSELKLSFGEATKFLSDIIPGQPYDCSESELHY
jgi:hypothetical protein